MTTRTTLNIIRIWNILIHMNESRVCKKVFKWKKYINKETSWSRDVQNILQCVNMENNFDNVQVCNTDELKLALINLHNKDWLDMFKLIPKLRNYLQFKNSYQFDLRIMWIWTLRSKNDPIWPKLKVWYTPTGRYKGNQVHERICIFCDLGSVEGEMHFIIKCPATIIWGMNYLEKQMYPSKIIMEI